MEGGISYLSKVAGAGKPGRMLILQLGWELQALLGGATLGQLLGVYLETVASTGLWRMKKWEEGTHIAHLRVGMSLRISGWAGRDPWAEVSWISLQGA